MDGGRIPSRDPDVEKRTSSWGVLLKRSGIGLAPADIVGRILDLGLGGRGGTGSTFIFPLTSS